MSEIATTFSPAQEKTINKFVTAVYGWMSIGLLLTTLVALAVSTNEMLFQLLLGSGFGVFVLIAAELGLVFFLSAKIQSMSPTTATISYIAYCTLSGMTLAAIFLLYTTASIVNTFLTATLMFGAMGVWGYTTQKDLSGWGKYLFMALIGIIIATIINIFLANSTLDFGISVVGVILFVGLTAYDHQRLRQMAETAPMDDSVAIHKGAIMGALQLYLDFINLFIYLLRLMGERR